MSRTIPSVDQTISTLTDKQREVFALVGEGRTSKEIANILDVSESAVVQRIEKIRSKFDGATRQELGRIWREHGELSGTRSCNQLTGKSFHLLQLQDEAQIDRQADAGHAIEFADSAVFNARAPWQEKLEPRIVPEVLDGENATLFRWAYAVAAALGMVIMMLVLLAVSHALADVL